MGKPKVSSDWCAGCSGCHMSFLDMDERLLQVINLADIRATPFTDLKHPDEDGVEIGIIEGGINNTTHIEVVKRMRERSKYLIAFGDCAVFGGVPAMRNFFDLQDTLRTGYIDTISTDDSGKIPNDPELAVMTRVQAISELVKVDIFLPGCPPSADAIFYTLSELAQGRMPKLTGDLLNWH